MNQHDEPTTSTTSDGAPDQTSDQTPDRLTHLLTDRRGILKAAGVVAGVGALAACSSPPIRAEAPAAASAASSSSASASSAPASTSAATPAETPAETPTSATPTSAAAGGTPTSQVPVGGGTIYADKKVVVTQPTAGTFKAFDTTCPHLGCPVTKVADGRIKCPCHGSQFDLATGARVAGPAETGLKPKTVTVKGGSFTVA